MKDLIIWLCGSDLHFILSHLHQNMPQWNVLLIKQALKQLQFHPGWPPIAEALLSKVKMLYQSLASPSIFDCSHRNDSNNRRKRTYSDIRSISTNTGINGNGRDSLSLSYAVNNSDKCTVVTDTQYELVIINRKESKYSFDNEVEKEKEEDVEITNYFSRLRCNSCKKNNSNNNSNNNNSNNNNIERTAV